MNIEEFRTYCLAKPACTEVMPFNDKALVFKVHGKMFALTDIDAFEGINLKCNPEYAIELREEHAGIKPGFHMNKVHWNTVSTGDDIPEELLLELIDHSYDLVMRGLRKKVRDALK